LPENDYFYHPALHSVAFKKETGFATGGVIWVVIAQHFLYFLAAKGKINFQKPINGTSAANFTFSIIFYANQEFKSPVRACPDTSGGENVCRRSGKFIISPGRACPDTSGGGNIASFSHRRPLMYRGRLYRGFIKIACAFSTNIFAPRGIGAGSNRAFNP